MNWGEIKLAALKKIDPAITSLTPTRNTKDYLNAIIPAANRGLFDLSTAGKYIVKEFCINIPENPNLLSGAQKTMQHINTDISYEAEGARAYYFETTGPARVDIYLDGTLALSKEIEAHSAFEVMKGIIPNTEEKTVKIVFSGDYPYQFRNVALYNITFQSEEDVWDASPIRRINLRDALQDFYKLVTTDVVYEKDGEYLKFKDYDWEGDSTLILDGLKQGNYKIHYFAYPKEITSQTEDDYELELDPEVASLLPVYIAAELYEDDDSSMAYYIREQYEAAKQRLVPTDVQGKAKFVDRWGWS